MPYNKKSTDNTYSIEPSGRSNVCFKPTDNVDQRSEKIVKAIKNDLYYARLQQLIAETVGENMKVKKGSGGKNKWDDMESAIGRVMEETGLKQALANVTLRLHNKGVMAMDTSSSSSRSSIQQMNFASPGAPPSSASCAAPAYHPSDEIVESIREARVAWAQGIEEEVHAMTNESARPFAMLRPIGEMNPYLVDKDETSERSKDKAKLIGSDPTGEASRAAALADDQRVMNGRGKDDAPRFLFDSEDLLETAASIVSENISAASSSRYMGLLHVTIATPSLAQLQKRFADLSPRYTQLGLDNWFEVWGNRLHISRQDDGELVASHGTMLDARTFLRRGITNAVRPMLWRLAFGLAPQSVPVEDRAFYRLRQACNQLNLLSDELYILDVQSTLDDHRYFVFEEELKEIMLCFSRDEVIRHQSLYCVHTPLLDLGMGAVAKEAQIAARAAYKARMSQATAAAALASGGPGGANVPPVPTAAERATPDGASEVDEEEPPAIPADVDTLVRGPAPHDDDMGELDVPLSLNISGTLENSDYTDVAAPPSAVQPFLGLCSYFAPLCFVFRSSRPLQCGRAKEGGSGALYSVARAAYCQIWCRLNVLSSDPGTLLYVCKVFEELLITTHPKLFLHLVNIGVQPLHVALPWIQLGFTTVLDIEEVLALWDRLFGFMDTSLLAILAAGIFVFKADALLACDNEVDAQGYLSECGSVKIVPILQLMLFTEQS